MEPRWDAHLSLPLHRATTNTHTLIRSSAFTSPLTRFLRNYVSVIWRACARRWLFPVSLDVLQQMASRPCCSTVCSLILPACGLANCCRWVLGTRKLSEEYIFGGFFFFFLLQQKPSRQLWRPQGYWKIMAKSCRIQ